MRINGNRLAKALIIKKRKRLEDIPAEKKDEFIDAYTAGATDAVETILEQVDEQLEEK